ncbi:MAG TPA: hypothetical protein VL096_11425 [Pirellulaceae bacterium]|nr:hypothetical protein [Pirellulaceae bacterium]
MRHITRAASFLLLSASALCFTTGCERKEKIIDIKTPNGSIEVERSKDTGRVDVDVDRK